MTRILGTTLAAAFLCAALASADDRGGKGAPSPPPPPKGGDKVGDRGHGEEKPNRDRKPKVRRGVRPNDDSGDARPDKEKDGG
jgi:hypothetical protein